MNRRTFIKAVPVLAVGASLLPAAAKAVAVQRPPAASIYMMWTHPDDPKKRHGSAYWNTPTMEEYEKAKEQSMLHHALLVSRGYKVECCELAVIRFVKR